MCPKHKGQLKIIVSIQREAKRCRDMLNRNPEPRPHGDYQRRTSKAISKLNYEIGWRRCCIWQFGINGKGCRWCNLLSCSYPDDFSFERLASSTSEHLICNQEVAGSSPVRGSNPN